MTNRVLAIDGPAGSGKSTTARAVAQRLGLAHLDSGALYRSLTYAALAGGHPLVGPPLAELARTLPVALQLEEDGYVPTVAGRDVSEDIRSSEVTARVSEVAALGEVRDWVNWALAAAAALHPRGVVVDGRDIGTVVFPRADSKVFLTASEDVRAARRLREMGVEPASDQLARIKADIARRDEADSSRAIAPLEKAADAVELDTSEMTFEEQVERIVDLAARRFPQIG